MDETGRPPGHGHVDMAVVVGLAIGDRGAPALFLYSVLCRACLAGTNYSGHPVCRLALRKVRGSKRARLVSRFYEAFWRSYDRPAQPTTENPYRSVSNCCTDAEMGMYYVLGMWEWRGR